jgi:hypothetical protein
MSFTAHSLLQSVRRQVGSQLSRFGLLLLVLALLNIFSVACSSIHVPPTQVHAQIRTIGDVIGTVRAENPTLTGLKDYDAISANAFSGRTDEEGELLIGRVYLNATQRLEASGNRELFGGSTEKLKDAIHRALSEHRPIERFSKQYFDDLLADTKRRVASDSEFRCAVATSAQQARYPGNNSWDDYKCMIDGIPWPRIACRTLILNDMADTVFVF